MKKKKERTKKIKHPKVFKGSDITSFQLREVGSIIAPVEGVEMGMFLVMLNEGGDLMLLDMEKLTALTVRSFIEKHGHKDFEKHHIMMFEVD